MKSYNDFVSGIQIQEAKETYKDHKIEVKRSGNRHELYVDGDYIDSFNSEKAAVSSAKKLIDA